MSFAKPLALAAVLSMGLVACGPKEETAEMPADTGVAVDTGAMSSSAPTTVNPADATGAMGSMAPTDPAAAPMPGAPMSVTVPPPAGTAGGTNTSPPTQGPVTPPK